MSSPKNIYDLARNISKYAKSLDDLDILISLLEEERKVFKMKTQNQDTTDTQHHLADYISRLTIRINKDMLIVNSRKKEIKAVQKLYSSIEAEIKLNLFRDPKSKYGDYTALIKHKESLLGTIKDIGSEMRMINSRIKNNVVLRISLKKQLHDLVTRK